MLKTFICQPDFGTNLYNKMEDKKLIKKALIDWVNEHTPEEQEKAYMISSSGSYSLLKIKEEVENETEFGLELADMMIQLTIDLLIRGKRQLS